MAYSEDRAGQAFRLRIPNGTDPNVISTILNGLLNMFNGIARHTDDCVFRQKGLGHLDWHIGLAQVYPSSPDSQSYIDAIVDDKRDIVSITDKFGLFRN